MEASLAKISGSWRQARSSAAIRGANSRAQKSRTVATSCSWSGVSERSSTWLPTLLRGRWLRRGGRADHGARAGLRRGAGLDRGRLRGWRRRRRRAADRGRQRPQVVRADVADERQVLAERQDVGHGARAVQLRLEEP